ncbi:2-oxoisovalerate dehydrogenase subunit beta [Venturia nashicola]|nr:2-oxoisovalerate dehydrogenase subunit beta [Venturia nashicola]
MAEHLYGPEGCRYVPLKSYNWSPIVLPAKDSKECTLPWNPTVYSLIAACHAAAVVMAFEINIQLLSTFKRWTTLYFWSLLVASWGVILLTVSFDLTFFDQSPGGAQVLTGIGWVAMVTGFSMILYSRLHLVLYNRNHLRILLAMILVDAFLFHLPVIVSDYVKGEKGTKLYWVVSKMEIIFCAQEFFLSTLYTYLYWKLFRDETSKKEMQTTFYLLIVAQFIILSADVVLSTLLYTSIFVARMMILPLTSALKIRIELLVLNRLAGFGQHKESITQDLLRASSTGATISTSEAQDKTVVLQTEETWKRRQEVSIWNVDGPACPEIIRPAEVSKALARRGGSEGDRDIIEDLERLYLGRYEYEKSG